MPMPGETDADRLAMIQAVDDTTAIFNGTPISVIFDNDYEQAEVGFGVGISGVKAVITARSSDLPGIREGNQIIIGTQDYTIAAHQPDGTGMTVLLLREAP